MASRIGDIQFISVPPSAVDILGEQPEVFRRSGVDGYGVREDGKQSLQAQTVVAADVRTGEAVAGLIRQAKAQQGTVLDVEDDFGAIHKNVLVRHVEVLEAFRCAIAVGGVRGGHYLVQLRYTLQQVRESSAASHSGPLSMAAWSAFLKNRS
jgi:hypothetical protein